MLKKEINTSIFQKFLKSDTITAADIGADGGISPHWQPYLDILKVDAFEPNKNECARQSAISPESIAWHPIGLANKTGPLTLYVPERTTGASIYPPKKDFIEKHGDRSYWGTIREVPIECMSFSDFLKQKNKDAPNLVKLDTQGSELDILSSLSSSHFENVLCVETEIEFVEMYKNQPLFWDLHSFMTKNGFDLLDLRTARVHFSKNNIENYYLKNDLGMLKPNSKIAAKLVAGDALYIKNLESPQIYESKVLLVKLVVCACIYHYFDLALWLLDQAELKQTISSLEHAELKEAVVSNSPSVKFRFKNNLIGKLTRKIRKIFRINDEMDIFWLKREWPDL